MIQKLKRTIRRGLGWEMTQLQFDALERILLAQGTQLATWAHDLKNLGAIEDAEFRIFSQFGDDGIIQYLISHVAIAANTFIEFGVSDYEEANTRFLLMNNNWSGFVLDGAKENVRRIRKSRYYWRHDLEAEAAFITAENINSLIAHRKFAEVGLLHIDIDGNDYWVWKAIDSISPAIAIIEYNSVFGIDRAITVPYSPTFHRADAHYSNLYFGASLPALVQLGLEKGYAFVGSNSAGNNAYFVRNELLNEDVREVSGPDGYRVSKFREGRNEDGHLTLLGGTDRSNLIRGLPVFNIETKQIETL